MDAYLENLAQPCLHIDYLYGKYKKTYLSVIFGLTPIMKNFLEGPPFLQKITFHSLGAAV